MGGIIGCVGNGPVCTVLLRGLNRLEYRGHDSAGIATVSDGSLHCGKDAGRLDEVCVKQDLVGLPGNAGIGHVRWATHGEVSRLNAHPHLDCHGEIAVAHNGIVDNHDELRAGLGGHRFLSQTDSEVLVHLIEDHYQPGVPLEEAVMQALQKVRGSYAVLAISSREPGKIVGSRRECPLVVGLGKDYNFIASEGVAFLEHTRTVAFVEDGETLVLEAGGARFIDEAGRERYPELSNIDWKWDQATKQGYEYYMMKEIAEVPEAIRRALDQDKAVVLDMAMNILRARQVVFTACGTSRYAALVGRYLFSKLAGKFCDVVMASEFHYFSDSIDKNTLVIAISQSGETADVIQGVKKAREKGATILSMVNMYGSSIARMSDRTIYLNCGPEIGVAATKSFMSQLAVLYMLAFTMANRYDEGVQKVTHVSTQIETEMKRNGNRLQRIAALIKDQHSCYFLARGINFAIAAEGALKLKEISYIHAEGMPAGELKHGTLALIEEGTPVVVISPRDFTFNETLANAAETKARGAFVVGVSEERHAIFDEWIEIESSEEIFYPLVTVVPLQLLAYYSAVVRGHNPDQPRNLAKSVTVK